MDARKAHKASSSSSSSKRWEYQVFLSFGGEDTRKGFIGHLHAALSHAGIRAYLDDNELERAEFIKTQLEQAIDGSMISIIVFSKSYADSTWCLDELVKIMECRERLGQQVIPLFYNVDASDVRKQTGSFALAFEKHEAGICEGKHEKEKVKRWRNALTQAADLCGEDLKNADGHEAKFIEKILGEVNKHLYSKYRFDIDHVVGITSRVKVLSNHLKVELDRAYLSAAEHDQVNQVLVLPSTERAVDILLASECPISSAAMRPSRNDSNMQARLMKLAKKGSSGGSAGASQSAQVRVSPHMSVARSQATSVAVASARGAQKRRADEQLPRDTGKRRVEEEPSWDSERGQVSSSTTPKGAKRTSVDPVNGTLEPWVDGELMLSSYHEAIRRTLKVEVVEGLFTEEMGYSSMTLSALEDQMRATIKLFIAAQNMAAHREFDQGKRDEQAVTVAELSRTIGEKAKVEEELELVRGRLEAEMKKNAGLLSSVNKLAEEKRGLGAELSKSHKSLDEANRKIEAFASELWSYYDDAVKDYTESTEYQEKLASQRVEGYFDLIEKVGEKYPSIDWSFLDNDAEEALADQDGRLSAEPVGQGSDQIAQVEGPSIQDEEATTREGDPTAQVREPTAQGG